MYILDKFKEWKNKKIKKNYLNLAYKIGKALYFDNEEKYNMLLELYKEKERELIDIGYEPLTSEVIIQMKCDDETKLKKVGEYEL